MGDSVRPLVVALAGHAGAGKTTAALYLASLCSGSIVYVGAYVEAELVRRNLQPTPENERKVRMEVREQEGMDAFARRALRDIEAGLANGPIIIDAIYNQEEWELYRRELSIHPTLVAILASQGERIRRVASRPDRSISPGELRQRDKTEVARLRLGEVFDQADEKIENDGTEHSFERSLRLMLGGLLS